MKRKIFSSAFKTKVVLEALKERDSVKDIAAKHKIHPQQISNWKREFISKATLVFDNGKRSKKSEAEEERNALLQTIGTLKVENDFLKKSLR